MTRSIYIDPAPDEVPKVDEYRNIVIKFNQPDTSGPSPVGKELWPGDNTPRRFINCNLINVAVPPGSELIATTAQIVEYDIPVGSDTLTIDGVVLHTSNYTENRTHGRFRGNGVYQELPAPASSNAKRRRP